MEFIFLHLAKLLRQPGPRLGHSDPLGKLSLCCREVMFRVFVVVVLVIVFVFVVVVGYVVIAAVIVVAVVVEVIVLYCCG